ncbi:MAG: hypothetical protein K9N55_18555 [Phycisphaerae bacterium]|nr:hypothetical protein [Phycisphaerae bacterium]
MEGEANYPRMDGESTSQSNCGAAILRRLSASGLNSITRSMGMLTDFILYGGVFVLVFVLQSIPKNLLLVEILTNHS